MVNILFVDDEPNLVQSLRRMFHKMKDMWQIFYATSGKQALEIMSEQEIDIIITDYKMPEMNGVALLSIIKDSHPAVIRILLSGYSDDDATVKSTAIAHQFLRKPISPEILEEKLNDLISISKFVQNPDIKNIVNEISVLPTLPDVYIEIDRALNSPETDLAHINKIIMKDVGLSTKILQVVNSAFFGISHNVYNTLEAISLLGTKTIQSIIINIHLFNSYPEALAKRARFNSLGSHSLISGEYAKQYLGNFKNVNKLDAYMAGILHDVGKLILFQLADYDEVEELMQNKRLKNYEAEYETYGTSHAEIGAYLLALWGLPRDIIDSTAYHHVPMEAAHKNVSLLTAVHIGDLLARRIAENIDWGYIESINAKSETEHFLNQKINEPEYAGN